MKNEGLRLMKSLKELYTSWDHPIFRGVFSKKCIVLFGGIQL